MCNTITILTYLKLNLKKVLQNNRPSVNINTLKINMNLTDLQTITVQITSVHTEFGSTTKVFK